MLAYCHIFPAGLIPGRDQHTVYFLAEGERATRAAAGRIADAVGCYVGAPLTAGGIEFIKGRIDKADCARRNADGSYNIDGQGWGAIGAEVRHV